MYVCVRGLLSVLSFFGRERASLAEKRRLRRRSFLVDPAALAFLSGLSPVVLPGFISPLYPLFPLQVSEEGYWLTLGVAGEDFASSPHTALVRQDCFSRS